MDVWTANWLDIQRRICLPDGRTWDFTHPCLTTFEAMQLGSWLQRVSTGGVSLPLRSGTDSAASKLFFTEPLLAFRAESTSNGHIELNVILDLEALPPWEPWERISEEDFVVVVAVTRQDLDQAIVEWAQACARFPER